MRTTTAEEPVPAPRTASRADLPRRLLTVAVLAPIVVWLVWRGGFWSAGLFAVGSGIATLEFYRLMLQRWWTPSTVTGLAAAVVLPLLPAAVPEAATGLALGAVLLTSMVAWFTELPSAQLERVPEQAAGTVQGLVFCAISLFWLQVIRERPDGFEWTIAVLATTWVNDAGAMLGGRAFGKHLLAPKVSPKKTWEGWSSGAVAAAVAAVALRALWPEAVSVRDAVALTVIASVFGPLGDLAKSMLKRARGAKDAGKLLPGHGGMLDRIDALLVTAPLVALYLAIAAGR